MNKKATAWVVVGFVASVSALGAEFGTTDGEWRTYGGDLSNTRYAPLDQIHAENFGDLEIAWRFSTNAFGPTPEYRFQSTPLMVNGVLYTTAGSRRAGDFGQGHRAVGAGYSVAAVGKLDIVF